MLLEACLGVLVLGYLLKRYFYTARHNSALAKRGIKPFSSIPGDRGLPLVGTFYKFMPGGRFGGKLHLWPIERSVEYGPIVRENMMGVRFVILTGAEMAADMLRHDGKYPALIITVQEAFRQARRDLNQEQGVVTCEGEVWKRQRGPWNHAMLKTSNVYARIDHLNEINDDFITDLTDNRAGDGTLPEIDHKLFRWSVESAGMYIFETRLGCLDKGGNPRAEEIIKAAQAFFDRNERLATSPLWLSKLISPSLYKDYLEATNTLYKHGKSLVDAKRADIQKDRQEGVDPEGFLSDVLASGKQSEGELYTTVSDLLTAAVETTSNSVQFALYVLATNPRVQQKVYEEICATTGGGQPTANHLRQMDYLKATVKEVFRLYPAGTVSSRMVNEDTVIGGYEIPHGVMMLSSNFANGRSEKLFPDPLAVIPERWLPGNKETSDVSPFVISQFGIGTRTCIGQKTAETEIFVLIIRLLQRFELRYGSDRPMEIMTKTLLGPTEPIKVQFIDRE